MKRKKERQENNDYFDVSDGKSIPLPERADVIRGMREQLGEPEREIEFEEWRAVITERFPDLVRAAEAGVSVLAQLLIEDITNPFGLVYVDPPASGKTIVLNFFAEVEEMVYTLDNLTASSFVSHAANKSKEALQEIDLLPKIAHRAFLIRDLAPLFGQRDDDLVKSMGLLTRVFDGEGLETQSGVHGRRGYKGQCPFMFLAASTPIQPRIWKVMGSFGSRLFFLSIRSPDKSDDVLADQVTGTTYKEQEKECREKTRELIKTMISKGIVSWEREKDDRPLVRKIAKVSKVLARLRSAVQIWGGDGDDENFTHTSPVIEKPDRINQLLYNLARGHAYGRGNKQIGNEDVKFVLGIAMDSAPTDRVRLFRGLIANEGKLTSIQVEKLLSCSRPIALKAMETLVALGLVNKSSGIQGETIITLKHGFTWLLEEIELEKEWDSSSLFGQQ